MATCAIYVRQSVDKAEGIDRQLARCRALAASRGWEIVAEFEDNAVSAFKSRGKGTAWARLLDSPAEIVVAVNLDRLLRGQADLLTLIESGKTVATVEGDLDLTTAEGKFRAELLTSLASFEARRKGERQKRANESRVASGLPVPGKRRFGFEPGNVEERPAEAEIVRKAYEDVMAGRSIRSVSIEWGRPAVRVREILTNPSYAGWVMRGGERFEAHPSVARIVDRDTWLAVQDLLADEARKTGPGPSRKHLLSGIALCECGATMRAMSRYYTCSAVHGSHATLYRTDLDTMVRSALAIALLEDDESEPDDLAPLARRLADLEEERSRWTSVAALPGADMAQVAQELTRIDEEATRTADELGRARVASVAKDTVEQAKSLVRAQIGFSRGVHPSRAASMGLQELEVQEARLTAAMDTWAEWFDGLTLDERRGLVASRLTVTVAKGRGPERVKIQAR